MITATILLLLLAGDSSKTCDGDKAMHKLVAQSDMVVVAKVIEVMPSDLPVEMWSGPVAVTQRVRYQVTKVLKGKSSDNELIIRHYVIRGSRTADRDRPRLSPKLFKKGNLLLIFVKAEIKENSQPNFIAFGENCGTVEATPRRIARTEQFSTHGSSERIP